MRTSFLCLIMIILNLCNCTYFVNLNPYPNITVTHKIDVDIGLVISESTPPFHTQSGFCLLGTSHTWNIATGMGLRLCADRSLKQVFRTVEMLNNMNEVYNNRITIFITPVIANFDVSQELAASIILNCIIIDNTGIELYDGTFSAKGESQMLSGCLFGTLGGEKALANTSNSAFNS